MVSENAVSCSKSNTCAQTLLYRKECHRGSFRRVFGRHRYQQLHDGDRSRYTERRTVCLRSSPDSAGNPHRGLGCFRFLVHHRINQNVLSASSSRVGRYIRHNVYDAIAITYTSSVVLLCIAGSTGLFPLHGGRSLYQGLLLLFLGVCTGILATKVLGKKDETKP